MRAPRKFRRCRVPPPSARARRLFVRWLEEACALAAERRLIGLRQRRIGPVGRVLPAPFRERPVPREARHARGLHKAGPLHVRRIERDPVRDQHIVPSRAGVAAPSGHICSHIHRFNKILILLF